MWSRKIKSITGKTRSMENKSFAYWNVVRRLLPVCVFLIVEIQLSTCLCQKRSTRNREIVFNKKLQRCVRSQEPGSVVKAEKLLLKTLSDFERNNECFHQKNSTRVGNKLRYVRPNHYSFGIVIDGYAKIRDPLSAEKLLNHMEDLYVQGSKFLRPDAVKYTACINAWARSNKRGSAHKAERLLRKMEQLYYLKGERRLKPTLVTYAAVIDCWSKNKERNPQVSGPRRAEDILKRMEFRFEIGEKDIEPDTIVYNSVLNAWANVSHNERNVPQHVENILQRMIRRYRNGISTALPDVNSYNILIKCWANSRYQSAPYRCEEILLFLESQENNGTCVAPGDPPLVKPNTVTYNTVLTSWLKSDLEESYERSKDVVAKMKKQSLRKASEVTPDCLTYSILNRISGTKSKL